MLKKILFILLSFSSFHLYSMKAPYPGWKPSHERAHKSVEEGLGRSNDLDAYRSSIEGNFSSAVIRAAIKHGRGIDHKWEYERLVKQIEDFLQNNPWLTQRFAFQDAFQHAIQYDMSEILEILIRYGASAQRIVSNGFSALEFALVSGALRCANILVRNGAEVHFEVKNREKSEYTTAQELMYKACAKQDKHAMAETMPELYAWYQDIVKDYPSFETQQKQKNIHTSEETVSAWVQNAFLCSIGATILGIIGYKMWEHRRTSSHALSSASAVEA
jgi:hypothetical protein